MQISAETKINHLLKLYPFLIDFFIKKSPKFKHLKNPVMHKTIGKVATLKQVAVMGNIDLEMLLSEIDLSIAQATNETQSVAKDVFTEIPEKSQTFDERQKVLKKIIVDLHKGEDIENLKTRFRS